MQRLHRLLDALGPAGIAGLGVALFCLPFWFTAVAPAQAEVKRRALAAERARARLPAQPLPAAADGAALDLERFYARFPRVERLPLELDTLYAHAKVAQVQLLQGEYRLESSSGGLAAYHVTLPVRGSYPQLRQFVGRVLKDMPTTSLDAVRFERKKAADAQLEAQVRLTIYLRKGT
jgi:hypothetical protein